MKNVGPISAGRGTIFQRFCARANRGLLYLCNKYAARHTEILEIQREDTEGLTDAYSAGRNKLTWLHRSAVELAWLHRSAVDNQLFHENILDSAANLFCSGPAFCPSE